MSPLGVALGVHMQFGEAAHPDWLPVAEAKPIAAPTEPSAREQEYADFGDWLSVIFGWVDDQERWWGTEDRIDQKIRLAHP